MPSSGDPEDRGYFYPKGECAWPRAVESGTWSEHNVPQTPEALRMEGPLTRAGPGRGWVGATEGGLALVEPQGTRRAGCRAFSAEVSVGQEQGRHQGPQVEEQPCPAGADLHPHRGPRADHLPGLTRAETHHPAHELGPQSCDLRPVP